MTGEMHGAHFRRTVAAAALVLGLLLVSARATGQNNVFTGCIDFRGMPVAAFADPSISDVSVATLTQDQAPVIVYNPQLMQQLHPKTRLFFQAHECAHHALGHLPALQCAGGLAKRLEQEADCYGIYALVVTRQVTDHDVSVIQQDLARLGQGDWDHLPGPMRAINLRKCLRARGIVMSPLPPN